MRSLILYSLCIIGLMILLTGCRNKKNNTYNSTEYPIIININEAVKNKIDFKLSEVVDSISYIPVESIIGDYVTYLAATLLKFGENYIISENYEGGGDVVCFDRSGKFVGKIARRGQGPGELPGMMIGELAIDEKHEIVYVLPGFSYNKIYKYDLKGSFLGEIALMHQAEKIAVSPSGQLLVHFPNWTGDLEYSCLLFDHEGNIVNKLKNNIFYKFNEKKGRSREGLCYIYNDQIHVKDKCDTLFVVDNNSFQPKYVFNTGKNHSNNITQQEYDEKITFYTIFETDDKVLFHFQLNERWYNAYYDKNKRKAFSSPGEPINNGYSFGYFINDMDDEKEFFFLFSDYQFNDKILIMRSFEFDRDELKKKISVSKYLEITNMLDSMMLNDESPVILSLYHLKK